MFLKKIFKGVFEKKEDIFTWSKKDSLDVLQSKRQKLHAILMNPKADLDLRSRIHDFILPVIDKCISEKMWNGQKPAPPRCHREHGFNLYKPD